MSWLSQYASDQDINNRLSRVNPSDDPLKPGFLGGFTESVGPGLEQMLISTGATVESGFSSLWQGSLDLAASALLPEPRFGGDVDVTSAERAQQDDLGQGLGDAVLELRPDPKTTGLAGQLLGGLLSVSGPLVGGAMVGGPLGAAAAVGSVSGYSGKRVAMAEGVDEATATGVGAIEGVTMAAGAALPAARIFKPLLADLGVVVGANVGLGVAQRASTAALLERNGYAEQAAQYRAFDGTAMAVDAVLGSFFFGIGRAGGRAGTRSPKESEVDSALAQQNARHYDTESAPGIPVDPTSASAHVRAMDAAAGQMARGEPVMLPDGLPESTFLRAPEATPSSMEIELQALQIELPAIRAELEQQATQAVPNVRDLRTETTTLQRTLAELDGTFRDRAKELQGEGLTRKQAESQARQVIQQERGQIEQRLEQISQQIETNRQAEVARGELAAIDRGELPERLQKRVSARAADIDKGFQRKPLADAVSGRTASLAESRWSKAVDDLARQDGIDIPRQLEVEASRPTESAAIYGTGDADGNASPVPRPGTSASARTGDFQGEEMKLVRDTVNSNPEAVINSGYDADGNPAKVTAAEALAEVEAEYQAGVRDAQSYMAAITCMLRG